jgi:transaldolase/glucose-6-phosphate isomerase
MPPATIDAFLDHGIVERTIDKDPDQAQQDLVAIERAGISMDEVTAQLQRDGIKLFADAFDELIDTIRTKYEEVRAT